MSTMAHMAPDERHAQRWRGVIPPVITPLTERGDVDTAGLERLIDHLLRSGVHGVFMLGSSGEGPWLTDAQRREVLRTAVRVVNQQVPVLAGVLEPGTGRVLEAIDHAAAVGVDAVVTTTPYYFATDASTQIRHFEEIAAYAPVPVMLYNIPSMTHNPLTAETVGQLLPNPQFIGIKDSAGEKDAFNRLLALKARRPDFCVLQGAEQLAAESVLAGADGIVPGLGNLVPGLFTDLFSAAVQGDAITATAIQDSINALWTLHTSAYWLVGLKYAASLMGFGSGRTSGFVDDLTVEQQSQIRALVEQASVAKPR